MARLPDQTFWSGGPAPQQQCRCQPELRQNVIIDPRREALGPVDLQALQRAAGKPRPVVFNVYYPTSDASNWNSGVDTGVLQLVRGYEPGFVL